MADSVETPEANTPPVDPSAAPPSPPSTPSYVPADEFKAFAQSLTGTLNEMAEGLRAMRASGREPAAPAGPAPVTDEELDAAVAAPGSAGKFRQLVRDELRTFAAQEIEPLRTTGLSAISSLAERQAATDLPYYARFEKDIKAFINTNVPVHLRTSPDAYRYAHDVIVGRNTPTLVAEAAEQALRKAAPAPTAPTSQLRPGRVAAAPQAVPTVSELMGEDAARAIEEHPRYRGDENAFARGLGYKDWADYARQSQEVA